MSKWASKAIITKAKAIYGNRLMPEDYKELVKKNQVSDVAEYLKNSRNYRESLSDIQESSIHRGQLEELVKKTSFNYLIRLIKFIELKDKSFYEINIVRREVDVILSTVRSMISGAYQLAIAEFPVYFVRHAHFDIEQLSKSKNFEELLSSLSSTPYLDILSPYAKTKNDDVDYPAIEQQLELYYYDEVFSRINKNYKGKVLKELKHIFLTSIELRNIIKIYRLKKFYKVSPENIKKSLILKYSRISSLKINEMIYLENPDEILMYLQKSEYSKYTDEDDYIYIEYYAEKLRYNLAKRYIHFSSEAPTVYGAYLILSEIEQQNVINIIESIRYNLNEQEIEKMLIY